MALIPNNGWESGAASGWTFVAGSLGSAITVAVESGSHAVRSGLYSLRLPNTNTEISPVARFDVSTPANWAGYQIVFKLQGRRAPGNSGTNDLQIQITASPDAGVLTTQAAVDVFTEVTVTKTTVPAGVTLLRFTISMAGTGGMVWNIDDMEVEVQDAGGNVVFKSDLNAQPGVVEGKASYAVEVDWDNDDVWTESGNAITADVLGMGWDRGVDEELEQVATGSAQLRLRNDTGKYTPTNASSALSPNVLPGRPVRIRAFYDGTLYNLFKGYIEKIVPHPAPDRQDCYIYCVDGMDRLARAQIEAPARGLITAVKMGGATQVTGVNITFANANPDTITRASGSFVTDGFQVGQTVNVRGSTNNNGRFVIATVTALVLTLHTDESLTAEGPVAGVTLDGYGPIGIILDEMVRDSGAGWAVAARTLDAGVDTLDTWWAHQESPLDAIRKLMTAERSLVYVNGAGTFIYEDRSHRLKNGLGGALDHLTSQGTFSDTMLDMEYAFSARSVRNLAVVKGHKRTLAASAQLWGTQDRLKIGTGEVVTVWAKLANPANPINAPATDGTDYGISSTSGGSDDSTLRSNVATVFTVYGQSVKMQFTNNNTQPVYIVDGTSPTTDGLYIDGQEYGDDEVFTRQEDTTSRTAYGERGVVVDNPFLGDYNVLRAYAQWLVSRYKDPQPDAVTMALINSSSALLTQQLAREMSDRITVTATELGLSSKDYYINRLAHEVDMGAMRHRTRFTLERVDEAKYWLLGIVGYGELGTNSRLGF